MLGVRMSIEVSEKENKTHRFKIATVRRFSNLPEAAYSKRSSCMFEKQASHRTYRKKKEEKHARTWLVSTVKRRLPDTTTAAGSGTGLYLNHTHMSNNNREKRRNNWKGNDKHT